MNRTVKGGISDFSSAFFVKVNENFFNNVETSSMNYASHILTMHTHIMSLLRHCTTTWKVAGSIPYGVVGIFR